MLRNGRLCACIVTVCFICIGLFSRPALADVESIRPSELRPIGTDSDSAVVVSAALSAASFMVGEPVVITLTIYNYSDREIYVHGLGDSARGDIEFEMRDEAGRAAPVRKYWGAGVRERPLIAAEIGSGYKLVHRMVVSRWVAAERPGRYTLTVKPRLRYCHIGETSRIETPLTSTLPYPVRIVRTDWYRLREVAERLHPDNWENNASGNYQATMFDQFTTVSGKAAAPSWLATIFKPNQMMNSSLIWRLSKIGDREAIDTLAAAWRMAAQARREVARQASLGRIVLSDIDVERAGDEARRALETLYTHGNPALKSYVGTIFRTLEGKLPMPLKEAGNIEVYNMDGPHFGP
jgi:hypothetical protein